MEKLLGCFSFPVSPFSIREIFHSSINVTCIIKSELPFCFNIIESNS